MPPITEWTHYDDRLTFWDGGSSEKVTELQANVFCNVSSQIRVVNIYAHIKLFDQDAFDGLQSITDLILSGNHMPHVHARLFKDVKCLIKLVMSNNHITFIEAGTFENLKYVEVLDLSQNMIYMLQMNTFRKQNRIKFLDLTSNSICNLTRVMLDYLSQLEELKIVHNCIVELDGNEASLSTAVQTLDLGNNLVWLSTL